MSEDLDPYAGETRAERRRRRLVQDAERAQSPAPSPYDPLPYGVRGHPDVQDAVIEESTPPTPSPAPPSPAARPAAQRVDGTYDARSARRQRVTTSPVADLAGSDNPTAAAAALQLLAAQAAAARLGARGAEHASTSPAPRAAAAPPATPVTPATLADANPNVRLATPTPSRTPIAGALAAPVAAARKALTSSAQAPAAHVSASAGNPRAPGATRLHARAPGKTSPRALVARVADDVARSRWRKLAFGGAAVLLLGAGAVLSYPHVGALGALAPSTSPTADASTQPAEPSPTDPAAQTENASAGQDGQIAPACAASSIAATLKPGDAAVKAFGAESVAEAYCGIGGVLRDQSFTDLAARRPAAKPYTVADFAPMRAYLSAALAAVRDKDVADLVATQSLTSAAGQRLSALTRLAWDNDKLKFDPAASAKVSKFELGPPVTWTAKGPDGVDRLGLGFETGMVTHMVDAAGRPAPYVLKRTYKLALVKGDAAHPWLIDAYEVGETTAALVTVTGTPAPSASPTTR